MVEIRKPSEEKSVREKRENKESWGLAGLVGADSRGYHITVTVM